jgi:hypothetical protein
MKVVPQSAIQMSVYDTTKDFMLSRQPGVELSNPQRLFAGTSQLQQSRYCRKACIWRQLAGIRVRVSHRVAHGPGFVAGSASTAATYPLEALRTHISLGRRGGYVAITRDIVRERVNATACLHPIVPHALPDGVILGVASLRPDLAAA